MATLDRVPLEAMDEELRELLRPRVERLGYLGDFFQFGAHQPQALAHFVRFTESLKDALPWRLVEIVALTVAAETANEYERVQHERLALRRGMGAHEIRGLVSGETSPALFGEDELAVAELARCVVRSERKHCQRRFQRLLALTDQATAVAVLLTAARYLAHSAVATTWRLKAPVSSPLNGARDA